MTDQERAVMQQALEALERLQNAIYNIGGEHVTGLYVANDAADSAEKPMGALRAALAHEQPMLTDDEIYDCREQGYDNDELNSPFSFLEAARAVERKVRGEA